MPTRRGTVPTYLAAVGRDDPEVSRDPIPALHFDQVPNNHLLRVDAHFLAVADHQGLLWEGKSLQHQIRQKRHQQEGSVKEKKKKLSYPMTCNSNHSNA